MTEFPAAKRPEHGRRPVKMTRAQRLCLASVGALSWLAGGLATFTATDGAGAAALIAAGVLPVLLALIGYWPSRIALSGNEMSWDEVIETVDEQIDAAKDAEESAAVRELQELRRRLFEVQRTGSVSRHPGAAYDDDLLEALRRIVPDARISAAPGRARERADFEIWIGEGPRLLVETKYKSDPQRPFKGSTLSPLWSSMSSMDRLLVVTNAAIVSGAQRVVAEAVGGRGRVITWNGDEDDDVLRAAIRELLA